MRSTQHRWRIVAASAVTALAVGLAAPLGAFAQTPNNPPNAVDDSATTNEDESVVIEVLDNDTDTDADTLEVTDTSEPANGTLEVDDDGDITYTPDADFNGTDTFTYTVSDGTDEDTATVTVDVEPVNDPPDAMDDEAETDVDTDVLIDVLANDEDVDGDDIELVDVSSDPANGTAVVEGDQVRYTPDAGFEGTDEFTYTIMDGSRTDTAVVEVHVGEDAALLDEAADICEAGDFTHPSLFALCRVLEMVPEEAQDTIARVIVAHAEKVAPGWMKNHGEGLEGDDRRGGPPQWVIEKKAERAAWKAEKKGGDATLELDAEDDSGEDEDDDGEGGRGQKGRGGPPWTR